MQTVNAPHVNSGGGGWNRRWWGSTTRCRAVVVLPFFIQDFGLCELLFDECVTEAVAAQYIVAARP